MGFSDVWWIDLWAFFAMLGLGLGAFLLLLGVLFVASEGREGWPDDFHWLILGVIIITAMGPLVLLLVPFIAIYRAVRNV